MLRYISSLPSAFWEQQPRHGLVVLGSTGSIGCSALDVVAQQAAHFEVLALAAGRNVARLVEQALQWRPPYLAVQDEAAARALYAALPPDMSTRILTGQAGYAELAALPGADTVLSAQVGAAGLRATLAAVNAGKVVCLANKESLVLAGRLIRQLCARTGAVILPVDSEHNAVFQAIMGRPAGHVRRVLLTASGGPFRGWKADKLATVKAAQALKHPNWSMGAKISIDSATLMNKGLEILEAHYLYDLPSDQIAVVVHPQSVVHSLVEMNDGSSIAQLGTPDMRLPIAHCLNWPHCADVGVPVLDLARVGGLTFEEADLQSFPCLPLARRAMSEGKGLPVVLNAANEVAVEAFLEGRISFMDIPALIERAMDTFCRQSETAEEPGTIETILALDDASRQQVRDWLET